MNTAPPRAGEKLLRAAGVVGAVVGYGCLAAFSYLVGTQVYRWIRDGEWTHIGVTEGMRAILSRCCVSDPDNGHLAPLMHWFDAPVDWLGLHRLLDALPASLALFTLSILGNALYIYCLDRLAERQGLR